jgi:hypothetical protein
MPGFPLHRRDISFKYQSQSISFSEWLSLLTLAFAPLVAHIFVGVARPIILSGEIPWQERVCHYNPTSIFWRYFAITDRRCRAKEWTRYDLAATNAVFWDGKHWDGSVHILMRKKHEATYLPSRNRISWASGSVLHTLIVTLQGIQAVYVVVYNSTDDDAVSGHPISYVFFPLAILGLLRLPAALWLTAEYGYRECEDLALQNVCDEVEMNLLSQERAPPIDDTLISRQFHPQRSWRGIAVRAGFLGVLLLLTATIVSDLLRDRGPATKHTLSAVLTGIYYLFFLVCTTSFFLISLWQKQDDTTVIPWIDTQTYKVYTSSLFLLSVVYVVVTALETRRTACGLYTTIHAEWGRDRAICKSYQAF